MFRLGFILNPIAGMGGAVGLKGTDGNRLEMAVEKGAMPVSPHRASLFLQGLKVLDLEVVTVEGQMGGTVCQKAGVRHVVLPFEHGETTTGDDTTRAVKLLADKCELLVFVGGDGTARDVANAAGGTPILGVPSGVKMFSAVFSPTPQEACGAVEEFMESRLTTEVEVMDVDEDAYAQGGLSARLYGIVRVPATPHLVLVGKHVVEGESEEDMKEAIAEYVAELTGDRRVLLGPGSTVEAVAKKLGVETTLLGVDIVCSGEILVRDGGARELEPLVDSNTLLVVSPIGAQGYFLGRGTQQITPSIVRMAGISNLLVVATPAKLKSTDVLRVDTGDPDLDKELRGYQRVISGYRETRIVKVA